MKNIHHKLTLLLFLALAIPNFCFSQNNVAHELHFEVNRIHLPLSITKRQLTEAKTLIDLNKHYKPSWVREYVTVEVWAIHDGKSGKVVGKNDVLSQEQKNFINTADIGSEITVKVKYIPENTLKRNDAMWNNFSFTVDPETEAKYASGHQQLMEYLKKNAISNISADRFRELHKFNLAAVTFSIDEKGQVIDPKLFWTSNDEKIDELLLESIRNMPDWKPAVYANGTKVKQDFVLTVGNHESCAVNLVNIRRKAK